jgi:hypothetical protein
VRASCAALRCFARSIAGATTTTPATTAATHSAATTAAPRSGTDGISTSRGGVQIRNHAPRISQRDALTGAA